MYSVVINKKGDIREFSHKKSAENFIREHNKEIINTYYYREMCKYCPVKHININEDVVVWVKHRCDRADLYILGKQKLECKNRIKHEPDKILIKNFIMKEKKK